MVRSILLRGFDQQIANLIGDDMETTHGTRFIRSVSDSLAPLDAIGFLLCQLRLYRPLYPVRPDGHLEARRRAPVSPVQKRRDERGARGGL